MKGLEVDAPVRSASHRPARTWIVVLDTGGPAYMPWLNDAADEAGGRMRRSEPGHAACVTELSHFLR
jgi:hypothetical protein